MKGGGYGWKAQQEGFSFNLFWGISSGHFHFVVIKCNMPFVIPQEIWGTNFGICRGPLPPRTGEHAAMSNA